MIKVAPLIKVTPVDGNSKMLSLKSCSKPKTRAPICVVVHSLHWMIHQSYWMIIKEGNLKLRSRTSKKSKWKISMSKNFKYQITGNDSCYSLRSTVVITVNDSQEMITEEEKIGIWKIENRKSQSGKFRSHKILSVKSRPQPTTPAPASVVVHSLHWMIHR